MKSVLLAFAILLATSAFSQTNNWAPVGAKWVYSYTFCISGQECGQVIFESIKDTAINGKNCRAISHKEIPFDKNDHTSVGTFYEADSMLFMYEDSGKVNVYDKFNDTFFTLYDFNLKSGETLVISDTNTYRGFYGMGCHSSHLEPTYDDVQCYPIAYKIVDDTTISLNGQDYYAQIPAMGMKYQGKTSGLIWNGELNTRPTFLIEGIGATARNMFGDWPDIRPWGSRPGRLLCYSENGVPVYEDTVGTCQAITGIEETISKYNKPSFQIAPNPSSGIINVSYSPALVKEMESVVVYNITGKEVARINNLPESGHVEINLTSSPAGLYTVNLLGHQHHIASKKVILNK